MTPDDDILLRLSAYAYSMIAAGSMPGAVDDVFVQGYTFAMKDVLAAIGGDEPPPLPTEAPRG